MGIPVGRFHFKNPVTQFQDGNIESTATQVEYRNLLVGLRFIQTVSQSGRRRFVDDTFYRQARDFARFLGSLTLRVAEVSRHGDDRFGHRRSQVILGRLLHLLQDDSRNFLRRVRTIADTYTRRIVVAAFHLVRHAVDFVGHLIVRFPHETLDRVNRPVRVGHCLTLGRVAHLAFPVVHKSNHGRSCPMTFAVRDNNGFTAFHYSYAGVSSSQVDTYYFSHDSKFFRG